MPKSVEELVTMVFDYATEHYDSLGLGCVECHTREEVGKFITSIKSRSFKTVLKAVSEEYALELLAERREDVRAEIF